MVHIEDGQVSSHHAVIDATRISDRETVMLKSFSPARNGLEKDITIFLATEPAKSHPRNHSNHIYKFETVGEASRQVFEGLQRFHAAQSTVT
ncbi:hypothetical protein QCA50_003902 [Cerrena zonata]|uniref:Uncharacterized protein n=1 Tax=Cerrena zonata TaxID=2478898 RepID=A0AAW0GQN3_9APHY